jgi:hypothetical protein
MGPGQDGPVSTRRHPDRPTGRAEGVRAAPLGVVTRGTTGANRLRRVDRYLAGPLAAHLRAAVDPLVVDLGFGASPVTTYELAVRLRKVRPDVHVVGVEIDQKRVVTARAWQKEAGDVGRLDFVVGGFDVPLPDRPRPVMIRALNVLRQYGEDDVADAWSHLRTALAPTGVVVEGTCDELGRRASWVTLDRTGPRTLTVATRLADLGRPSDLAARLPKVLIHRNRPGEWIHRLLADADDAWDVAAAMQSFGVRQRWLAMVAGLRDQGWPVQHGRTRWRLGELTVAWPVDA